MPKRTFHFYMDDSGTRHPDHATESSANHDDWFGLGGVIVEDRDEDALRDKIESFKAAWGVAGPLHSHPIRRMKEEFSWLKADAERRASFHGELSNLLVTAPVVGHACVIDRPSYNLRYAGEYGRNRWSLCKTTFSIAVERAAKFAISRGGRLRIYVERSSKPDEQKLKEYYDGLRAGGNPFNPERSAMYAPLDTNLLHDALFEFRTKKKSSPIMQLADLYLYPICRGGYNKHYLPYELLCQHGRLIDQHLDAADVGRLGIKYSCFDSPDTSLKTA
jgi:hypothetical protein